MKDEDIINQLTESLDCSKKEVINVENILNMTEYWVENICLMYAMILIIKTT